MNTSVYDFNEGDTEPYLAKNNIFEKSFNHGRTPYGKQEKHGKSISTTSRKKHKTVMKRLTKKKSQRTQISIEATSNGCSSASDSIEADDSDSEPNQDKRKLEMRFGGALGISCLNKFRDEDHLTEQSRVVMHGEQLVFLERLYSLPEFIFTADGIVLKIQDSGMVLAVNWALHDIKSFRSGFDQEKGLAFVELDMTEHGIRTSLLELGQSDTYCTCHTLLSSISRMESAWEEDIKKITSLSDDYKRIWRNVKEDMSELFYVSMKNVISRRQDPDDQHLFVDCIACDRNKATSENWFDIIFPTKDDQDAVTVTQYDFMLLNPDQFLSDTIIDFYIKYLQSLLPEDENKRFYFYNSFFFRKLTEVDKNFQIGLEKSKSSFERVKRWTAKINIFEKDYLFIPIMQSAHWSLVIVCHPGSLSAGCQDACDAKAPMILHFDSLEGCHTCVEEPIRNYIIEAWNEKNGHGEDSESLSMLKFVAVKAPQQTNYSDCGLFLLHYVELFIAEVLKKDSIEFISDEWFDPVEASSKRTTIQSLIERLRAKELAEHPEKAWCQTPSNVIGPGAWSAQRAISFGDEYLEATNLLPGNMLDQACSMLVSYPQQYQNDLQVYNHTQLGHHFLESGHEQLLVTRELQQCFFHSQSQAPDGKLSTLHPLQQEAANLVQDMLIPNCTCVGNNSAVHDMGLGSLHDSIEVTFCSEDMEDLHPLNRGVAINSSEEFSRGLDNDASGLVGENCIFIKSDSLQNNGVDAKDLFEFSHHYDGNRVSDITISTVQKFSLDDVANAHAFQGSKSQKYNKQPTGDESFGEYAARCNSESNEYVEPMVGLIKSAGDAFCLEGKETINEFEAAKKCVEGGILQHEDVCAKMDGDISTQGESLTQQNPQRVSSHSSPSEVERIGLDRPLYISSDGELTSRTADVTTWGESVTDHNSPLGVSRSVVEGIELDRPLQISSDVELTPIAARGSREGKRRGSRVRNAHQSPSATRRITRSASKIA